MKRDRKRTMERRRGRKLEEGKKERKLLIRSWSHTRAAHVCVVWEWEGRAVTWLGGVSVCDTPEMRKFHIPEERKEACGSVAHSWRQRLREQSLKALFWDYIRSMSVRRKEEPTKQRYQANARERDRTHRWKANCVDYTIYILASRRVSDKS